MYGLNRSFNSKNNLIGKSYNFQRELDFLYKTGFIKGGTDFFDRINMYFLNRSMHQVNEACNKLWSTLELYHAVKSNEKLCKTFNENFLSSSTIPTLHYANISAILSILSIFGLLSIVKRKKKMLFYNIVRTKTGILIKERTKYLIEIFGTSGKGWHVQILQTYKGFLQKGIELPNINIENCSQLLKERLRFHYDILSQTSMKDIYGIEKFFQLLPITFSSINDAITSLHQVVEPLPNGCDLRFNELNEKIQIVKADYNI